MDTSYELRVKVNIEHLRDLSWLFRSELIAA